MSPLSEAQAIAASLSQASKASYLFSVKNSKCNLLVVKFTVDERISHPYEIDIILATQDEVVLEDLLDQECLLTIEKGVSKRYFHGVVRECTCLGDDGDYSIFHILAVPSVWLLSLEQDCRIFPEMNVQDIICTILKESHIEGERVRIALKDKDRHREFCVQYRETDLNFISRLLEEEGIFYFFEHYKDKHVIVFADNQAAYLTISGKSQIRFNSGSGTVPEKESVSAFIYSRRLFPGKSTQRDYNYNRVNLDLTTEKNSKSPIREVYDYPGNYFKEKKGNFVAQIRQERFQVLGETAEGVSDCPRMTPGYRWELTDHDFEGKFLTVAVTQHGSQPQVLGEQAGGGFQYHNEFLVIPSDVIVRPQINAVKPIITGVQTAVVVGTKGEEIHTDDLGRVKVQFHWDRLGKKDGKSSCWIRVAQSWGGLGRGSQYIPRIGDEVLVDFAEGDPDRPIITGSIYNGDNQPINSLKKSITQSGFRTKTHKGAGGHELRFDDANGKEEIFLHSQKDCNINVNDRKGMTVGGDKCTVIVKNCDQSVGGDSYTIVTGKQTEIAKEIIIGADTKITIVSGASFIEITPQGIKINGSKVDINDGSSAPSLEKRPVTGSTGKSSGGGGGGDSSKSWSGEGGASGGGGASGSWSEGGVKAAQGSASPPVQPQQDKKMADNAPTDDNTKLEGLKGAVPSGGWAGTASTASIPEADKWTLGSVSDKASGLGGFVSSGSSSALGKSGISGAGDLVASASSKTAGLQANIAEARSTIGNASSIKDAAINGVKNKANDALHSTANKMLDKTGIPGTQTNAAQQLNNLGNFLKKPDIA